MTDQFDAENLLINTALDLPDIAAAESGLFANASTVSGLDQLTTLTCQTFRRDSFLALRQQHIATEAEIPRGPFAYALCRLPAAIAEAEDILTRTIIALADNGTLIVAAPNNAGGRRIPALLESLGLSVAAKIAKSRCTLCITRKPAGLTLPAPTDYRPILDGAFISRPGIFGWNQIDAGSALLARFLPETLPGNGADMGCGYGFLSRACKTTGKFYCADIDSRAVEACRRNVPTATAVWLDLSKEPLPEQNLDFIVMNPPFHTGKKTDPMLGQRFIATAHAALKPRATLWMVANAHLPYEHTLETLFPGRHERLAQESGFKIFKATRQ